MKIINKTKWRTDHLRAFVTRIARMELDADHRKHCVMTIVSSRRPTYISGYASIGGYTSKVRIPTENVDKARMCAVIAHELAHNRGMRGEHSMRKANTIYSNRGHRYQEFYAWAYDMPLEKKVAPRKITRGERSEQRILRLNRLLVRWEGKALRAKNAIKKINRQLKYYERKRAACVVSGERNKQ